MSDLSPEGLRARASDLSARLVTEPFAPLIFAAFTALVEEAQKTERTEYEGLAWCLEEIKTTLAVLGCSHGHEHAKTPPMMFPEWIVCVVAHRVAEARRAQREADCAWLDTQAEPIHKLAAEATENNPARGYLRDAARVTATLAAAQRTQETP